jgi:hypothetical protein
MWTAAALGCAEDFLGNAGEERSLPTIWIAMLLAVHENKYSLAAGGGCGPLII